MNDNYQQRNISWPKSLHIEYPSSDFPTQTQAPDSGYCMPLWYCRETAFLLPVHCQALAKTFLPRKKMLRRDPTDASLLQEIALV